MVLGNISYDLDTKVKIKGQIMNYLVNESLPNSLDIANSSLYLNRTHILEGTRQRFVYPRSMPNNVISCKCISNGQHFKRH